MLVPDSEAIVYVCGLNNKDETPHLFEFNDNDKPKVQKMVDNILKRLKEKEQHNLSLSQFEVLKLSKYMNIFAQVDLKESLVEKNGQYKINFTAATAIFNNKQNIPNVEKVDYNIDDDDIIEIKIDRNEIDKQLPKQPIITSSTTPAAPIIETSLTLSNTYQKADIHPKTIITSSNSAAPVIENTEENASKPVITSANSATSVIETSVSFSNTEKKIPKPIIISSTSAAPPLPFSNTEEKASKPIISSTSAAAVIEKTVYFSNTEKKADPEPIIRSSISVAPVIENIEEMADIRPQQPMKQLKDFIKGDNEVDFDILNNNLEEIYPSMMMSCIETFRRIFECLKKGNIGCFDFVNFVAKMDECFSEEKIVEAKQLIKEWVNWTKIKAEEIQKNALMARNGNVLQTTSTTNELIKLSEAEYEEKIKLFAEKANKLITEEIHIKGKMIMKMEKNGIQFIGRSIDKLVQQFHANIQSGELYVFFLENITQESEDQRKQNYELFMKLSHDNKDCVCMDLTVHSVPKNEYSIGRSHISLFRGAELVVQDYFEEYNQQQEKASKIQQEKRFETRKAIETPKLQKFQTSRKSKRKSRVVLKGENAENGRIFQKNVVKPKCVNCGCGKSQTPQWRFDNRGHRLCNNCYMYQKCHNGTPRPKELCEKQKRKLQSKCRNKISHSKPITFAAIKPTPDVIKGLNAMQTVKSSSNVTKPTKNSLTIKKSNAQLMDSHESNHYYNTKLTGTFKLE